MNFARLFMASAIVALSASGFAAPANDWRLVKTNYTVGASKLVAKDQGLLEVNLQLTCIDKATDVSREISDLVTRLDQVVKSESKYSLTSLNPEVSVSSQNQFEIRYADKDVQQLNPFYFDVCKNVAVNIDSMPIDLTQRFFTASATLKIETQTSLAGLGVLRQKLQQFAEGLNKETMRKQVSVETESYIVSAKKRDAVIGELNNQSHLTGDLARDTRLKLDQALGGGFSELYITSVSSETDRYPEYKRYAPVLTENGKSKVVVPYTFSVQYNPSNIANSSHTPSPAEEPGTLSQQVDGEVVVDTDYYLATLNFSTACQPSKKSAMESLVGPFDQFRKMAQSVVNVANNNPYERLEENIGSSNSDGKWQPWIREVVNSSRSNSGSQVVVKSYISLCDGKTIGEVKEQNLTYAISHRIALTTNNFAGLKKLAEAANAFTEAQRNTGDPKRVEVELSNITPFLKDAKHFEVVDVLAYRSALNKFIDPQGEVAKKLLDEIQAGEAYYTATRGNSPRPMIGGAASGVRMAKGALESADEMPFQVVITSDGNIPMSEIRVNNTYSVAYRPKKNLIQVLKEVRSGEALKIGSRP